MRKFKIILALIATLLVLESCAEPNVAQESATPRVTMSSYESPLDAPTLFSLQEPYIGYATITRISEEQHEQFIDPVTNSPTMGYLYYKYLDIKFEKGSQSLNFRVKIFSDLDPKISLRGLGVGDWMFIVGAGDRGESGFIWFSPRYMAAVDENTHVLIALRDHDVTDLPLGLVNEKFQLPLELNLH